MAIYALLLALAAYVCPLPAQVTTTPSLPNARTARELGVGLAGGIAGFIVGTKAGSMVGAAVRRGPHTPKHEDGIDPYGALGMIVGQSVGSAVGVYYSGRMNNVQDSFGQTLIGATVGGLVGAASYFANIGSKDGSSTSPFAVAVMVVAAPIGAVIGFNHSRHMEVRSGANAELRRAPYRLFSLRIAF